MIERYRKGNQRYNEYQRPHTCDQISVFFRQKGLYDIHVQCINNDTSFFGDGCEDWKEKHVPVFKIQDLTFGQWEDEALYLMMEHRKVLDNLEKE